MTSLLVNHILQTEKWTSPELFETKNRIYTFLNPVSYLIALENKSLFEQFDGIFADGSLLVSEYGTGGDPAVCHDQPALL